MRLKMRKMILKKRHNFSRRTFFYERNQYGCQFNGCQSADSERRVYLKWVVPLPISGLLFIVATCPTCFSAYGYLIWAIYPILGKISYPFQGKRLISP